MWGNGEPQRHGAKQRVPKVPLPPPPRRHGNEDFSPFGAPRRPVRTNNDRVPPLGSDAAGRDDRPNRPSTPSSWLLSKRLGGGTRSG